MIIPSRPADYNLASPPPTGHLAAFKAQIDAELKALKENDARRTAEHASKCAKLHSQMTATKARDDELHVATAQSEAAVATAAKENEAATASNAAAEAARAELVRELNGERRALTAAKGELERRDGESKARAASREAAHGAVKTKLERARATALAELAKLNQQMAQMMAMAPSAGA